MRSSAGHCAAAAREARAARRRLAAAGDAATAACIYHRLPRIGQRERVRPRWMRLQSQNGSSRMHSNVNPATRVRTGTAGEPRYVDLPRHR